MVQSRDVWTENEGNESEARAYRGTTSQVSPEFRSSLSLSETNMFNPVIFEIVEIMTEALNPETTTIDSDFRECLTLCQAALLRIPEGSATQWCRVAGALLKCHESEQYSKRVIVQHSDAEDQVATEKEQAPSGIQDSQIHTIRERSNYLDQGINCYRKAQSLLPKEHPARVNYLNDFGVALCRRKADGDLDEAALAFRAILQLAPKTSSLYGVYLANLGFALWQRDESPESIDEAVKCYQDALDCLPAEHVTLSTISNDFGSIYYKQGNYTKAIDFFQKALKASMTRDGKLNPKFAIDVAKAFFGRGEPGDLTNAIVYCLDAKKNAQTGDPSLPMYEHNLGILYKTRGDSGDLNEAINSYRRAFTLLPEKDPLQAKYATDLGNALLDRDSGEDVDELIKCYQTAVERGSSDGPESRATYFYNLAYVLETRRNDANALEAAIQWYKMAIQTAPAAWSTLATAYSRLGLAIKRRESPENYIDESIQYFEEALRIITEEDGDYSLYLIDLGFALETRGKGDDTKRALDNYRKAANLIGEIDHGNSGYARDLESVLRDSPLPTDQEESKQLRRRLIQLDFQGENPQHAEWLRGVANMLLNRESISNTAVSDDLTWLHLDSIPSRLQRSAVSLTAINVCVPKESAEDNLEAIACLKKALELDTEENSVRETEFWLAFGLAHRFAYSQDLEDLVEAVRRSRKSISERPIGKGTDFIPTFLMLGIIALKRASLDGVVVDLKYWIEAFEALEAENHEGIYHDSVIGLSICIQYGIYLSEAHI